MPQLRNGLLRSDFRAIAWSGLALALTLLALLSGRGQEMAKAENPAPKPDRPTFDLTYVPPDATGVIAVRPNVIFSDPAMVPLARLADEALTELLSCKIPVDQRPSVAEIEQVIAFMTVIPNKGEPKGVHNLTVGPVLIRATHDFNWLNLMQQLDPKTEKIHHQEQVYYKSTLKLFSEASRGTIFYYTIPDKRTLAILSPKDGVAILADKEVRNGGIGKRPHFSWDENWKHVEHSIVAVAMDNHWAHGLSAEQIGGEPWTKTLTQHASTMVAGVDWVDGIDFRAYLAGKDSAAADRMLTDIKALIAEWRRNLEQIPQDVPKNLRQATSFGLHMYKNLLEDACVTRRESTIRVHTSAKINIADVAKMLFGPMPPK